MMWTMQACNIEVVSDVHMESSRVSLKYARNRACAMHFILKLFRRIQRIFSGLSNIRMEPCVHREFYIEVVSMHRESSWVSK